MKNATISGAKSRASRLIPHMAKSGIRITMPDALEAISAAENNSDWNRYQAALKNSRSAPDEPLAAIPHTVLACDPGMGSSAVTEALFTFDMEMTDVIPIFIKAYRHNFPSSFVDRSKIFSMMSVRGEILHLTEATGDVKSKVSAIVIFLDESTGMGFIGEDKTQEYAKELASVLKGIQNWHPSVLKKIGRVIVGDFEVADSDDSDFYSRLFPDFMRSIRKHGGQQSLLVQTMSDRSQDDLYSSTDAYEIITMSTHTPLFEFSPLPVLRKSDTPSRIRRYGSIFRSDKNQIRDAVLYITPKALSYYKLPPSKETKFSMYLWQFIQNLHAEVRK